MDYSVKVRSDRNLHDDKKAEMTQEDVANILGRNKQTIVNWENGVTEIKVHDLIALSELYKIPIEYLEVPPRRK